MEITLSGSRSTPSPLILNMWFLPVMLLNIWRHKPFLLIYCPTDGDGLTTTVMYFMMPAPVKFVWGTVQVLPLVVRWLTKPTVSWYAPKLSVEPKQNFNQTCGSYFLCLQQNVLKHETVTWLERFPRPWPDSSTAVKAIYKNIKKNGW